jgi:hypothetical protein
MLVNAGQAYYSFSRAHTFPGGLLFDPSRDRTCAERLRALAAQVQHEARLSAAALIRLCGQLYRTMKVQAMRFLVGNQWLLSLARELGITITDSEVMQLNRRIGLELFRTKAALDQSLVARHMSVADMLVEAKQDLVAQKMLALARRQGKSGTRRLVEAAQRWTSRTTCEPEYIVEHCREYSGKMIDSKDPPPSVVIERIVTVVTGRCVNVPGCGPGKI